MVGGGTGPADGTRATTCTPAPFHMKLMLQSTDELPLNFGFTGKVISFFHEISAILFHSHTCAWSPTADLLLMSLLNELIAINVWDHEQFVSFVFICLNAP